MDTEDEFRRLMIINPSQKLFRETIDTLPTSIVRPLNLRILMDLKGYAYPDISKIDIKAVEQYLSDCEFGFGRGNEVIPFSSLVFNVECGKGLTPVVKLDYRMLPQRAQQKVMSGLMCGRRFHRTQIYGDNVSEGQFGEVKTLLDDLYRNDYQTNWAYLDLETRFRGKVTGGCWLRFTTERKGGLELGLETEEEIDGEENLKGWFNRLAEKYPREGIEQQELYRV